MRILLIDNYDSYAYILFRYLWELTGVRPDVVKNDQIMPDVDLRHLDAVVISPGPGTPTQPRDLGQIPRMLRLINSPVLGVCMGHQALAWFEGARVVRAPRIFHGKESQITHNGSSLFNGIPNPFTAVRYHSLVVERKSVDARLWQETAIASDGQLMALAHRKRPWFGLQFHPESVGTPEGKAILNNFLEQCRRVSKITHSVLAEPDTDAVEGGKRTNSEKRPTRPDPFLPSVSAPGKSTEEETLPWCDPEQAFVGFFSSKKNSFWLDTCRPDTENRYSYLGFGDIVYTMYHNRVEMSDAFGKQALRGNPFEIMSMLWRARRVARKPSDRLRSGLVGYLCYEAGFLIDHNLQPGADLSDTLLHIPENRILGCWIESQILLCFDHVEKQLILSTSPSADGKAEALKNEVRMFLSALVAGLQPSSDSGDKPLEAPENGLLSAGETAEAPPGCTSDLPERQYLKAVGEIQRNLKRGEIYEACLTRRTFMQSELEPFEVYKNLRRLNPAPYCAYLKIGSREILCSSPERFLKLSNEGELTSIPIKGTRPRGQSREADEAMARQLQQSSKDRSENLMIVDLVRNDFSRVCARESVSVPRFMKIETLATVHQLVSKVRGLLRPELTIWDAIRACFPGGSMTGAPKARAMEILRALEKSDRDIYSGTIGFIDDTGTANLNIVIRTIVAENGKMTTGSGGAVVMESTPEAEYREARLKESILHQAIVAAAKKGSVSG